MICIYCREDSAGTVGRAHVIPESIVQNEATLPIGLVCDVCNNRLGRLDAIVASHPMVAAGIQLMKLPGKSGRHRQVVGNVSRREVTNAITIPTGPPEITDGPNGRTYRVTPLVPKSFDELRFRRGLHHIALNLIGYEYGGDVACKQELDRARRYVRDAKRGEAWAFAELMLLENMPSTVQWRIRWQPAGLIVEMDLIGAMFCVDLYGGAALESYVTERQRDLPELRYVAAADRMPRETPQDGRRYRIEIFD